MESQKEESGKKIEHENRPEVSGPPRKRKSAHGNSEDSESVGGSRSGNAGHQSSGSGNRGHR